MVAIILLLALGQVPAKPTPTVVKGHAIGETFKQFVMEEGYGLQIGECRSAVQADAKAGKKIAKQMSKEWNTRITLATCSSFIRAVDGYAGEEDAPFPAIGPSWNSCALDSDTAVFYDGELERIDMCTRQQLTDLLPFLIEKYGNPTETSTSTAQNGFGAQFQLLTARWMMPDGTFILACDDVSFSEVRGYVYSTHILVASQKLQDTWRKNGVGANPF